MSNGSGTRTAKALRRGGALALVAALSFAAYLLAGHGEDPGVAELPAARSAEPARREAPPDGSSRTELPAALAEDDPVVALGGRRQRPEWRFVAGVTRRADTMLGTRCAFQAFDREGSPLDTTTVRGPFGVFALEVPPEAVRLRAASSRLHLEPAEVELPDGNVSGLEIVLPVARGEIRGRVVDEEAVGASDVQVVLNGDYARRTTDGGGWFGFSPLRDGSYSVTLRGVPFAAGSVASRTVQIQDGAQVEPLVFVIERGATLTGRAIDASTRAPIRGITIVLARPAGESHRSAVTDEDGEFVFTRLAGGEYVITASSEDGSYGRLRYPVPPLGGHELRDVTLELAGAAGSIEGRFVDDDGLPLPFAPILGIRVGEDGETLERLSARTDTRGRFAWRGVAAGRWRIEPDRSWCENHNWIADPVPDLQVFDGGRHPVELRARAGSWLKGRVVSAGGRADLQVRLVSAEGTIRTKAVGSRGRFVFGGLAPASYTVEAVDPNAPDAPLYRTRVYVSRDAPAEVELPVP